MTSIEIKIEGMSCGHCVMAVKKELTKLGLESFDVQIGLAKINYDESKVNFVAIDKAVEEAGFKIRKD